MIDNCNTCEEKKQPLEGWWCNQWIDEPDTCLHHTGTFGEQLRSAGQNRPLSVADKEVNSLKEKLAIAEAALKKIAKWRGEFPRSGRTFETGAEMSYGAAFGSNGERDYMRQVAKDAREQIKA